MKNWVKIISVSVIVIFSLEGWLFLPSPSKIDVLHYDLKFDLYPDNSLLKGDVLITCLVLDKSTSEIDLDFYDNLKITDLRVDGKKSEYSNSNNILLIKHQGNEDTIKVEIIYEGTPKHVGFSGFVFGEFNKKNVVYNLSETDYASSWFPCNDVPSDKALLDISITNDSSMVSVSNGILVGTSINNGRKTYHWRTGYPIATYLICIYSADYVTFSDQYISQDRNDTLPIQYYVFPNQLKNAKIDFEDHPKYIDFFSKTFGEYPCIKEKYGVAEFLWQLGAMEHQTITGIGSNFVTGRKNFSEVYTHELAHHWWGDAVSPASWKDIWLNEGFATYSEALYAEHIGGAKALQSVMLSKDKHQFKETLYDPKDDLFGPTVYDKGGWVLHMLRRETGDSLFFQILRTYFSAYKYKNASTDDFKKICEQVSGKDFDKFFDQWVYNGKGIIEMEYGWSVQTAPNGYDIKITTRQTQDEYNTYNFPLDFKISTAGDTSIVKTFIVNKRQNDFEITLKDKPDNIEPDPSNWLLAVFKKIK
ncbi:MAG: M1 family metallopeptidase [Ignavibacteriaceae bacterium]|nr:M1 family metallopeptidase [Ignavibacteriaceae bacterium]